MSELPFPHQSIAVGCLDFFFFSFLNFLRCCAYELRFCVHSLRYSPVLCVDRAGLDYWHKLEALHRHDVVDVQEFVSTELKDLSGGGEMYFFSGEKFSRNLFEVDFAEGFREPLLQEAEELGRDALNSAEGMEALKEKIRPSVTLVFGSETQGFNDLDQDWLQGQSTVSIPMFSEIRSFNLASSAAMAMFETRRQENVILRDLGVVGDPRKL